MASVRAVVDRECDEAAADESSDELADEGAEEQVAAAAPAAPEETQEPASETFVMPPLVGMNLQLAQDTLQASGSFILTQTDGLGLGRFQVLDANWKVCGQRPSPGQVTDIAFMVELVAVKLEESC